MAALSSRSKARKPTRKEYPNDRITVTATLGDVEPGKVYCLVKAIPVETTKLKAAIGFGA